MNETLIENLGKALILIIVGISIGMYLGKFWKRLKLPYLSCQYVWSIGIFEGKSPLNLTPSTNIANPVLTYKDVTDVAARFVADPFMVFEKGIWYLFFEVLNSKSRKGEIGVATSKDGIKWSYRQIVLNEPFHLSFPYVFKWNDSYYMVPETAGSFSIRIYKSLDFPTKWSFLASIVNGAFVDPAIFHFDNKWWLLAFDQTDNRYNLHLFFADELLGPWTEHPKSPIYRNNLRESRPGGRVINYNGKIIRYVQDDYPTYGAKLRAFEITKLTTADYEEKEVSIKPVLEGSKVGWNAEGMHTVDPHQVSENKWIACVDGRRTVWLRMSR